MTQELTDLVAPVQVVHSLELCHNSNYFCESGIDTISNGIFTDDPLWDGQDCPTDNTCCTDNNPPWVCREVDASTSDIELRVCRDSGRDNEDIQLELVEIYIQ